MASGLKVTAPASLSNINCGFDILGAAMDVISDELIGRRIPKPGVNISEITGAGKHLIGQDPNTNTAGVAIMKFLDYAHIRNEGIEITIHKNMKPGSGLGSSAASACAAVVLANALFGNPLTTAELFPLAVLGEHTASRAFHGDNVAPCLFGGITLVRDLSRLDVQRLTVPAGLYVTLLIPDINILTSESRSILKPAVDLKKVVRQSANLGAFVLALERSDFTLMREATYDVVIEPQRAHFIPGFHEVRTAAHREGALACGISGSGPALFAFSDNSLIAERAGKAMQAAFAEHKIVSEMIVTRVNQEGTVLH